MLTEPPDNAKKAYLTQKVDDITFYYPPGLVMYGPALRITVAGFWIFKWLKIEGVAPAQACAI